jgi:hypothetical protein
MHSMGKAMGNSQGGTVQHCCCGQAITALTRFDVPVQDVMRVALRQGAKDGTHVTGHSPLAVVMSADRVVQLPSGAVLHDDVDVAVVFVAVEHLDDVQAPTQLAQRFNFPLNALQVLAALLVRDVGRILEDTLASILLPSLTVDGDADDTISPFADITPEEVLLQNVPREAQVTGLLQRC